jgi:hypothetical protein
MFDPSGDLGVVVGVVVVAAAVEIATVSAARTFVVGGGGSNELRIRGPSRHVLPSDGTATGRPANQEQAPPRARAGLRYLSARGAGARARRIPARSSELGLGTPAIAYPSAPDSGDDRDRSPEEAGPASAEGERSSISTSAVVGFRTPMRSTASKGWRSRLPGRTFGSLRVHARNSRRPASTRPGESSISTIGISARGRSARNTTG